MIVQDQGRRYEPLACEGRDGIFSPEALFIVRPSVSQSGMCQSTDRRQGGFLFDLVLDFADPDDPGWLPRVVGAFDPIPMSHLFEGVSAFEKKAIGERECLFTLELVIGILNPRWVARPEFERVAAEVLFAQTVVLRVVHCHCNLRFVLVVNAIQYYLDVSPGKLGLARV